ncbi:MAG: hypothetical protein JSS39_12655 [Nitrospira sp.]|nr:hypothetical protein [Nitrospira sp.]
MQVTAVILLLLYFGVFLIPKAVPWFGESLAFFVYCMSLLLAFAVLAILGVWGAIGMGCSQLRREQARSHHRFLAIYAALGFMLFGVVITLSQLIPHPFPSGSDQLKFDSSLWTSGESFAFVKGDITPRQKMLSDVVAVLPGKTRSEIEAALGPSLDTLYFASTGRDLIYFLGPERTYLSLDSEWLLIWLDENGRFLRYSIAND